MNYSHTTGDKTVTLNTPVGDINTTTTSSGAQNSNYSFDFGVYMAFIVGAKSNISLQITHPAFNDTPGSPTPVQK